MYDLLSCLLYHGFPLGILLAARSSISFIRRSPISAARFILISGISASLPLQSHPGSQAAPVAATFLPSPLIFIPMRLSCFGDACTLPPVEWPTILSPPFLTKVYQLIKAFFSVCIMYIQLPLGFQASFPACSSRFLTPCKNSYPNL